jgi:hypothetical protein
MNHLTTKEILEIVDGTIANGERTKFQIHLEGCQRCRQEVQFQRSIGRAAREIPCEKPSNGFTTLVIRKIAPETKRTWVSKLIDNLGNIMAMAMVLGAVWYAITLVPQAKAPTEPSVFSKAIGVYVDSYARAREAVSKGFVNTVGEPKKEQTSKTTDVTLLTLISLLILVAIDRFVVRRLIRIRH